MGSLPDQTRSLLSDQVSSIAEKSSGTLGLTLVVSVALSLWAASSGVAHLNEAINIAYDEEGSRGFIARRGLALALTVGGVVFAVIGLAAITAGRSWLSDLLPSSLSWISAFVAFAILAVLFLVALSVLFRFAPMRDDPKWRWVTPGALVALVAWLAGSVGFGFYVNNFGSYNETYGSLAAVIVLLLWLFLSSFVVLLAGELNAELEHQTAQDTTVGPEEPLGVRGATVADTVAGEDPRSATEDAEVPARAIPEARTIPEGGHRAGSDHEP